ncbi:iodothyronine deiodinase [Elysia marginata]|uniref:Iodothyronine deiodinase n=1 Tax=Elysia marginata TaxID=1093978 RepID=A0AAV4IQ89_9GAST|nr:iodothyronine deiodinase [Elysia marginata]
MAGYSVLANKYASQATFLTVYIREAHPMDGEWPDDESYTAQMHKHIAERIEMGKTLQESGLAGTLVVDSMEDLACTKYGALPEKLCLLTVHGRVAYMGDTGPFGYSVADLETALVSLCAGH